MSNLFYKNPISPIQVPTTFTVSREKSFGTNFSVLSVGGYMEVYNLSDLVFNIPVGQIGNIELSSNIIPIHFKKSNGNVFSYDVLTLNSDNISSGRRRLGMLVYVYETKKIYQHTIDNYDTLWSAATGATGPGGKTVVISDFGTTVKNNTVAGQNFINSWTASTIEGVNGYTNLDATWRELKTGGSSGTTTGDYLPLSGGTVTGDTIFQSGLTANTISATTYQNLPVDPDTFVTGFTLTNDEIVLTQNRDDSYSSFTISLSAYTGVTSVTASSGLSGNTKTGDITLINTSPDQTVTISGGAGISTGGTYPNFTITNSEPDQTVVITGGTNIEIISDYPNFGINFTGQTSFPFLPLSGGTVTGDTIFQSGLTANTISATTYFNLPKDIFVTGGTYSSGTTTFTNNGGGTFTVTGFSTSTQFTGGTVSGQTNFTNGLTANTISATTYSNLPIDPDTFVTGFTLSSNTITLTQNRNDSYSSFTISLSAYTGVTSVTASSGLSGNTKTGDITLINTAPDKTVSITGGTNIQIISDYPNFGINFTGTTSSSGEYLPLSGGTVTGGTIFQSGLTATTISATTYFNLPDNVTGYYLPLSGGTVTGNTVFQSGLTANTLNVTGNTLLSGLTANIISATTYSNLPNTLYTGDGTLSSNRVVNIGTNMINFSSSTYPNNLVLSGGNVGIGTESPSAKLEVSGNSIFNLATDGYIKLKATNDYPTYFQSSFGNTLIANNAYFDGSIWIQAASGGASMIQMEPTLGQFIFNTADFGVIGSATSFIETVRLVSGNTGINVSTPTNKLHISASSDPIRVQGVQTGGDTELLTIDGSGVVHKILTSSVGGVFLRNKTNSGATNTITINQSIFNPSNLTVLSGSTFIIDADADYYVLGDLYNSGTTIVNGTLKVGGIIYNSGSITGSGIIE